MAKAVQKPSQKNAELLLCVCVSVLGAPNALKDQVILEDRRNRTTPQDSGTFQCPVDS